MTAFTEKFSICYKKNRKAFLSLYLFALFINLPLIVLRLTNDLDGLWNQDDYVTGYWECSIGRWFWTILDKLRFNISLDPIPAIIALAVYSVTLLIAASALELPRRKTTLLSGLLFLAGVGLTCQLSFSFNAIAFSAAFLLSVLAVWLITRCKGFSLPIRIMLSAISIALMMACYQANIGVTCLLALFVLLFGGVRQKSAAEQLRFAVPMLLATAIGAVLYLISLKLMTLLFGIQMSDYQGFSSLSPAYLLAGLPEAVRHCYRMAQHYFIDGTFCSNRLIRHRWFPLFYLPVLLPAVLACRKVCKNGGVQGFLRAILYVLGILLIPIAACCYYLLAPETETHMQMTISLGAVMPLLLCLSAETMTKSMIPDSTESTLNTNQSTSRHSVGILRLLPAVCALLLLYGGALQCLTDEYAMYAGRRATQTLAEGILMEANRQGYDYVNGQILITDSPHSSKTFYTSELYDKANSYAQYGNWSHDVGFSRVSWNKFYSNYLRLNVSFSVGDTETTIAALPEVAAMPSYPASGSIQNIYGVLVVKLGE